MTEKIMVEDRCDTVGVIIKEHDVLRQEETGEMALVVRAGNPTGAKGLAVLNEITGLKDWLDVFPNGLWTIVGNAGVSEGIKKA